jgi:hypothetical protein
MARKAIIASIIIVLLSVVFYISIYIRDLRPYERYSFLNAIPQQSTGYIIFNNPSELALKIVANPSLYDDLKAFPFITNQILNFLARDSTLMDNAINGLSQSLFAISFDNIDEPNSHTIYFTLHNRAEEKEVKRKLKSYFKILSSESFEGLSVIQIEYPGLIEPVYCYIGEGLIVVSSSKNAIQRSIMQLSNDVKIHQSADMQKLDKTTNKCALANVFINIERLPEFLKSELKDGDFHSVSFINKCGTWCELDVNVNDEKISLVGLLNLQNDSSNFSLLFHQLSPSESTITNVFPSNTCYYQLYNLGSSNDLIKKNLLSIYRNENLSDTFNIQLLYATIDQEVALLHTKRLETGLIDKYFILKVNSQSQALNNLGEILQNQVSIRPITYFAPDDETKVPIYEGFKNRELSECMSFVSSDVPDQFFACHNNYIIFSNSIESLSQIIYDNLLEKTLVNQELYRNYMSQFASDENFFVYLSPGYLPKLISSKVSDSLNTQLAANINKLDNFYGFGMQLSKLKDQMYVSIVLNHNPNRESAPVTIWESKLDSAVLSKPVFVTNHYTHEKEILVQDKKNILYHINNAGLILWKKPLDGPILGIIEQIDFYKNKKLQFVFNTRQMIYIIDRNGNYVDNYPLKLASPATNQITIFDYEKNMDYRFFIACEDRSIMGFNKNGNRQTGWKFKSTEGLVTLPIVYTQSGDKDFLIVTDEIRHYILDRKGNERVKLNDDFRQANSIPLYLTIGSNKKVTFVTCSSDGSIAKITLPDGDVKKSANRFDANQFSFRPLNTEGNYYLFSDKNRLCMVDSSLKVIWDKSFVNEILPAIDIYQFSSGDFKIGVIDKDNFIHLYNSDGFEYNGFPLKGTSRYSIGFLNSEKTDFNLIVGGTNNFLFNYSVK